MAAKAGPIQTLVSGRTGCILARSYSRPMQHTHAKVRTFREVELWAADPEAILMATCLLVLSPLLELSASVHDRGSLMIPDYYIHYLLVFFLLPKPGSRCYWAVADPANETEEKLFPCSCVLLCSTPTPRQAPFWSCMIAREGGQVSTACFSERWAAKLLPFCSRSVAPGAFAPSHIMVGPQLLLGTFPALCHH